MSFEDVIRIVLPQQGDRSPHVTGHYGEHRAKGPHGGSDFNYVGGQSGINLTHPALHSPVSGEVVFVGGQYGTIKIKDAEGNTHEILHTQAQLVKEGQKLEAGDAIGTMGGRGPRGANQYAQHVHYQIKDSQGRLVNPEIFWGRRQFVVGDDALSPTTKTQSASADCVLEQGDNVRVLQRSLNKLGYHDVRGRPLAEDGNYASRTKEAVEAYQRANGLNVDGITGSTTMESIAKQLLTGKVTVTAEITGVMTVANPEHPDHALFKQSLDGLKKFDPQKLGFRSEQEYHNAAATLAFEGKISGLKRVDHVVLSSNGKGLFAVQGRADDPAHHRVHVDKAQAASQPIEKSTLQMDQERQSQQQLQQQQQTTEREPRRAIVV